MPHTYETNGAAIYLESFATIRAEADLARFTPDEERVAVRMIHAAGLVGLEKHVQFSENMAQIARAALADGAPILCDAHMVSEGITRTRLPADNQIICTLRDPKVPELAQQMGNTRSAAALELWRPHLAGALVAIGNAPTALFHLLNMLEDPDCPRPAADPLAHGVDGRGHPISSAARFHHRRPRSAPPCAGLHRCPRLPSGFVGHT